MSRFSTASRETAGQVVCLPDKEFRSEPYSRHVGVERSETLVYLSPCMSPCRWDHLMIQCPGSLAYGL